MPPQLRELLHSVRGLTVDSVSQSPFVVDWGDGRGPGFYYQQARAEADTQLPIRQGRSIRRILRSEDLAGVSSWEEAPPGRALEVDDLVSRDAPLFSLLRRFEDRDLLLCLGPDGIDGVVTVYDLNQPAAHMFALGIALFVEAELARVLTLCLGGERPVERHVTATLGAKSNALKRWGRDVQSGAQVDLLSYLTFYEKMRCLTDEAIAALAKATRLEGEEVRRQLREVRLLRNDIAHYTTFELSDYRAVVQRMTIAYRLARRLASWDDRDGIHD